MKVDQSDSLQHIHHTAVEQVSPDDLVGAELSQGNSQGKSSSKIYSMIRCNIKKYLFITMLLIISSVLVFEINANAAVPIIVNPPDEHNSIPKVDNFTFLVYCPQINRSPEPVPEPADDSNNDLRRRRLQGQQQKRYGRYSNYEYTPAQDKTYNYSRLYIVEVMNLKYNTTVNGIQTQKAGLFYCGLTRGYYDRCDDTQKPPKYLCSSPGAMFDLQTGSFADIVWINTLKSSVQKPKADCLNNPSDRCKLHYKLQGFKDQTFIDPTQQNQQSRGVKGHSKANEGNPQTGQISITYDNWPISTHVHGAQVRPTFDGNPLSWVDNQGNRGLGALSLLDQCYYDQFTQFNTQSSSDSYAPPPMSGVMAQILKSEPRAKINRYPNIQNPGNLWYHDHAMRLTSYNVQNGLSGVYILRNTTIEDNIGINRYNQKIVMLAMSGWKNQQFHNVHQETVYRVKFLNNQYSAGATYNLSFRYKSCGPSQKIIDFTIIGADSSLFDQPMYKQKSVQISNAERIQLLIKFTSNNTPEPTIVVLCDDKNGQIANATLKPQDTLPVAHTNIKNDINNVTLGVPFTNFNNTPDNKIAVKRMRPLISMQGIALTINGRKDFHVGKSQNPTIGTYEDWFLINTMNFSHPIHIHLINFQVVNQFQLLMLEGTECSLYELDFIAQGIFCSNGSNVNKYITLNDKSIAKYKEICIDNNNKGINAYTANYTAICIDRKDIYNTKGFADDIAKYVNIQNKKDADHISGINVLLKEKGQYKYVEKLNYSDIKSFYKKWKDTALIPALYVLQLRIRWAKSAFNQSDSKDTYFHVPADQLRQYPGFVYHCHILPHEDNEMMRPIMLQVPDNIYLRPNATCSEPKDKSWATKKVCLNKRCSNNSQR